MGAKVPCLMNHLAINMLVVFYELSGDSESKNWFLDLLQYQASIGKDGLLEHTRIDK